MNWLSRNFWRLLSIIILCLATYGIKHAYADRSHYQMVAGHLQGKPCSFRLDTETGRVWAVSTDEMKIMGTVQPLDHLAEILEPADFIKVITEQGGAHVARQ